MAVEVDLAAGNLAGGAAHAEALARLPFYRDEDHLATCRRLLVGALAGDFDDVVRTGEQFRSGWERAGRPVAPNLARGAYAAAMAHGMRGDDHRRAAWVRLTIDLGADREQLTGLVLGWPPVFDGLLALHRNDAAAAMRRPAADIDTPELFHYCGAGGCGRGTPRCGPRPPCSPTTRTRQSASSEAVTPPATTRLQRPMVERAAAIATGDRDTLVRLAITFAQLGCRYQQTRTGQMAAQPQPPAADLTH
jgi:hypothetical protein